MARLLTCLMTGEEDACLLHTAWIHVFHPLTCPQQLLTSGDPGTEAGHPLTCALLPLITTILTTEVTVTDQGQTGEALPLPGMPWVRNTLIPDDLHYC